MFRWRLGSDGVRHVRDQHSRRLVAVPDRSCQPDENDQSGNDGPWSSIPECLHLGGDERQAVAGDSKALATSAGLAASSLVVRVSRRALVGGAVAASAGLGISYATWRPGRDCPLPRGPWKDNAAWLTHAWWGDERWYEGATRRREDYFGPTNVERMARRLRRAGVVDWFVHGGPSDPDGRLPRWDAGQARLLIEANAGGSVLAWVGGVVGKQAFPSYPRWREAFARSCAHRLEEHALSGIHLNIEPCESFLPGYLETLDELRDALPVGARLSVAAYPPPTMMHPFAAVHWNGDFYREVSARCDDISVIVVRAPRL